MSNALLILLFALGIIFFIIEIGLPFFLREVWPQRFWIGALLSFILGPFGHNYLHKSGWWIVGLIFIWSGIKTATQDAYIATTLTWIMSGFAFMFRFRRKIKLELKIPK